MKFFSLFAGIGGFELGMTGAGHKCVGACEWDKYARETYNKNFGHYPEYIDATKLDVKSLPRFDVLCAGFPCQAFSVAGQRRGFNDTRGTLFFEIARIAKEKRPPLLFLENVKGLLHHDQGRTFQTMLLTLEDLGYDVEWQVLNSKYFVPQNRERVFIIGHLRERSTRQVFPLGEINKINDEISEKTQRKEKRFWGEHSKTIDATYYKTHFGTGTYINELKQIGNIDQKGHNSLWGRVYDPKGIAPTQNAEGGGLGAKTGLFAISHTKANMKQRYQQRDNTWSLDTNGGKMGIETEDLRIRKLTPIECERLQGFPDNWTAGVSDTQRYKQCGNAVTVNVIKYIAHHLKIES